MLKKLFALLSALILCLAVPSAMAEDAVSSATLSLTALPALEENQEARVLVAYFSTDDTMKAAAWVIADALNASVFELIPADPYTEADLAYYTNCRADREQNDSAARPALAAWPQSMEQYDAVLIGYPIWHGQAPRIVYTLLEGIDLSGKTVIPFCTSASSGAGASARSLQALTDETAVWMDAKRIDNGSTEEEIRAWALSLGLKEENAMIMKINDAFVAVDWEDNASVRALRELAKNGLTIRMSMYGGFEQVGAIGQRLPSADQQTTTASGDIVLYSSNQLVVFYGSNSWAYTKLGRITDQTPEQMRNLLGGGDAVITLTLNENEH